MPQIDTIDPGMGSDPLADATAALQNAVAAAQAFNSIAVLIADFAQVLTTQQVATIDQIALETRSALDSITKARDAAIAQIINARAGSLDRRAQHNQASIATSE